MTCCTHNCDQGRTCPLRKRRTWREVVAMIWRKKDAHGSDD